MTEPVLVYVDDEPALCRLFPALMGGLGPWRIETFCSASEALTYLREHGADLLLCDFRMPEMTGAQLIESLDECPPCVMVTGDSSLDGVDLDQRLVRAVVRKPFRYQALAEQVKEILEIQGTSK